MAEIKTINKYFMPITKDEKEIIDLRCFHSFRIAKTVSIDNANETSGKGEIPYIYNIYK